MKFAVVVVMIALALGAQASILPWGLASHGHGLSYTAVSGPAVWDGAHVLGAHVLGHGAVLGHHGPVLAHGPAWGHASAWDHGHAAVVAAAPAHVITPVHHEGQYVAKTRGAVHTAPLSGHINSAASINLQPAPGTI